MSDETERTGRLDLRDAETAAAFLILRRKMRQTDDPLVLGGYLADLGGEVLSQLGFDMEEPADVSIDIDTDENPGEARITLTWPLPDDGAAYEQPVTFPPDPEESVWAYHAREEHGDGAPTTAENGEPPMTETKPTPEFLLRNMAMITGADPANGRPAQPGTEGHREPHEPWSAPVMVIAGYRPAGTEGAGEPWLYLACVCGWWLGYAPQMDPAELARIAGIHGENCERRPAEAKAG